MSIIKKNKKPVQHGQRKRASKGSLRTSPLAARGQLPRRFSSCAGAPGFFTPFRRLRLHRPTGLPAKIPALPLTGMPAHITSTRLQCVCEGGRKRNSQNKKAPKTKDLKPKKLICMRGGTYYYCTPASSTLK